MELKSLRKSDFVTSIIIMLFGGFVTIMALQMPMTASYGGVQAHWYVAPSLFPLCIGVALILLGALLCYVAVKDGGFNALVESIKMRANHSKKIDEKTIRVWVIVLALASFIYLYIPYIDFVVSIAIFLFFICSVFYSESRLVFVKLSIYFLIQSLALAILFGTGIGKYLISLYPYTMDFLAILCLIWMNIYARQLMKADGLSTKKIRTVMIVSIVTPLILCPVFRYPLLTPLPNEGVIIDHMNVLYYSLKY
ncbi:MAG: tripartite tricarboxylate transporter TctB family protein [Spirochaetales bacterium]|nr:tripartite tricarboxylate transporter TctB family protein [Spirochaetales bacterium]